MGKISDKIKYFFIQSKEQETNELIRKDNFLADSFFQNFLKTQNYFSDVSISNNIGNRKVYLSAYKNLVATCIDARAQNVAKSKPILYEMLNQTEKKEVITDHPIISIIQNPNDNYTWYDLIFSTIVQQDLTGNCFWEVIRNKSGYPIGFNILPTEQIDIKIDNGRITGFYLYKGNSNQIIISKDNIIHFRYPNSCLSSPYGTGIIEKGSYEIDIYNYQNSYQKHLFENDGRISSILHVPSNTNPIEKERLEEMWKQYYTGPKNAGKTIILDDQIKYTQVQVNPKELDYTESSKKTEDKVMMLFQVPRSILGNSQDVNKANAYATIESFTNNVVAPLILGIDKRLNKFIRENFNEKLLLEHEPQLPNPIDYNTDFYIQMLGAGVLNKDEVRTAIGYKSDNNPVN